MARLKIYNSLTREKQYFEPIDQNHIRIYACGPTVYSYAHIGNARMSVVFDVLSNVLKQIYPKVTYVSNITDVDDKIITASKNTGEAINEITNKYTDIYNEDMQYLGVAKPDIQPRATDHIPHMIDLIQNLIDNDHAYESDGHVLFNVPSFPAYGGLSGRSRDEQIAGARVEVASYKKDPADFVLWKPSSEEEPGWDSPWGFGRPGWHIECSAMAAEHLGLPFDIHGGGADLKFPHHENEIAQSCCAHGNKEDLSSFAKYWVHNGFVTVNGEKMSKSLGNVTLAHDLAKDHAGETLRLTLLSAHYRQPLDWSDKKIEQSKKQLDSFYGLLKRYTFSELEPDGGVEPKKGKICKDIMDALSDDLNTPLAISHLHAHCNAPYSNTEDPLEFKADLLAAGKLLGILQQNPDEWLGYGISDDNIDTQRIEDLLQERNAAKQNKDFARSDKIRDELTSMGIAIEDTADGAIWKKIS
ncbi:MAG: cysteine--tRNA ligase [Alphaproteobacteria bacterium]